MLEIAETGLAAATAKIAARAGIATGTLFTYFVTKEELLNELYLQLKREGYARVNREFPRNASLERRVRHIWTSYLEWTIEFPLRRKVVAVLNMSDLITADTRAQAAAERKLVETTLRELEGRKALQSFPAGFAAAMMSAMQEATRDFIAAHPRRRKQLSESGFAVFWRAVQ